MIGLSETMGKEWVFGQAGDVGRESNDFPKNDCGESKQLPCSMKILREFYFADWRFFVVCGNKFLRFEMAEISAGN